MSRDRAFIFFTAAIILLGAIVSLGVSRRQVWRSRARILTSAGRAPLVAAELYGAAATAEVAAGSGVNTSVQDLKTPSISGFSTDLFSGDARLTYLLDTPAGRGGLTPTISLNYSAAAVYDPLIGADFDADGDHDRRDVTAWQNNLYEQSSEIGLGWSLGGLGYIYRDSRGRYTLVLNNRSYRLFRAEGVEGAADSDRWHSEPENFFRIRHRVIANEEPAGEILPDEECTTNDYRGAKRCVKKFEITDSSGTHYTFSPWGFFWKRCDARGAAGECLWQANPAVEQWAASYNRWVLSRVRDVHGNEIEIPYDKAQRQLSCGSWREWYPTAIYPEEINYSGSLDQGFAEKIDFVYEARADYSNLKNLDNGCAQVFYSPKRLARIEVKVKDSEGNWVVVRRYRLDNNAYFTDPSGRRRLHLRLKAVRVEGREGGTLPSYRFDYYDNAADLHNYRLLKTAANGYGGQVNYRYEMFTTPVFDPTDGHYWQSRFAGDVSETHRVTARIVDDGVGNRYQTRFTYSDPKGIARSENFNAFEFVGHARVVEEVLAQNSQSEVLRRSVYEFVQGDSQAGRFFPVAERGRLKRLAIKSGSGKLLSFLERDYLREPNDHRWGTTHFVALAEERSCRDPTAARPHGRKTTHHYRPQNQGGRQWGNRTQTTIYRVPDCRFDEAQAFRMRQLVFYPNTERWLLDLPASIQDFACNSDLTGTIAQLVDCPRPRRLSFSWNIYDGDDKTPPWTPPQKGLLTLTRAWYEFPEAVSSEGREFGDRTDPGRWRLVDTRYAYDDFGNLTLSESFADYGWVQTGAAAGVGRRGWLFGPAGNGSRPIRSETRYDPTYNTFVVETINPLGYRHRTRYQQGETLVNHPYLADRLLTQDENDINNNLYREWRRDDLGRTRKIYLPGESLPDEEIGYSDSDGTGLVVERRLRDGPTVWQIFNGLGQLVQTQTLREEEREENGPQLAVVARRYNALGQMTAKTLPFNPGGTAAAGQWVEPDGGRPQIQRTYDALGRLVKEVLPGGRVWESAYFGRQTARLDPNRRLTVSEVDSLGRLTSIAKFWGQRSLTIPDDPYTVSRLSYNHRNQLQELRDSEGRRIRISYNQFGQRTLLKDPDLGRRHYRYDPSGRLAALTDSRGRVISYEYDDLDRLRAIYYGEGVLPAAVTFVYDDCANGIGRRCRELTADRPDEGLSGSTTSFNYDTKGRLISERRRIGGDVFVTQFAYDTRGRLQELFYPDGETVAYRYNPTGEVKSVRGETTYLKRADYNIWGQPTQETWGNNTQTLYEYQPETARLAALSVTNGAGQTLWSQRLTYDPVGNITEIAYGGTATADRVLSFSYDDLDRLQQLTTKESPREGSRGADAQPAAAYNYDRWGRLTERRETLAAKLEADINNDCVVDIFDLVLVARVYGLKRQDEDFAVEADLNGDGQIDLFDLVRVAAQYGLECPPDSSDETTKLEYDNHPPLHAPKRVGGIEYLYDANGNLSATATKTIVWNSENRPIKITDAVSGAEIRLYYDANGRRLIKQTAAGKTVYVNNYYQQIVAGDQTTAVKHYFAANRRLGSRRQGELRFHHQDYLGSNILETGPAATPTTRARFFFPYGHLVGGGADAAVSGRYLFAGKEQDSESGFYNFGSRLYNPLSGSFISADPAVDLVDGVGLNRYAALRNNPLRFVDRLGTEGEEIAGFPFHNISSLATEEVTRAKTIIGDALEVLPDEIRRTVKSPIDLADEAVINGKEFAATTSWSYDKSTEPWTALARITFSRKFLQIGRQRHWVLHEVGHVFDIKKGGAAAPLSSQEEFKTALAKEYAYTGETGRYYNFYDVLEYLQEQTGVSGYGYAAKYLDDEESLRLAEAFAEGFAFYLEEGKVNPLNYLWGLVDYFNTVTGLSKTFPRLALPATADVADFAAGGAPSIPLPSRPWFNRSKFRPLAF